MGTVSNHTPALQGSDRYARGIQRLDPTLADRMLATLKERPTTSKSALARELGVSRQTIIFYMRNLRDSMSDVVEADVALKKRRATTQLDLVDDVARAAVEIEQEIAVLKTLPAGERRANAIFKGFGALATFRRLHAELLGELSPQTTNIYLTKVEQLLTVELADTSLPEAYRGRIGGAS